MFGFSAGESEPLREWIAAKNFSPPLRTDKMRERDEPEQSELDEYGIKRVPADVFLWGGYRYSQAHDALAAAKRGATA
jgi:formate-dependent nitrite reductase cytochrome c552 subunit